jgi:hypothetical protein
MAVKLLPYLSTYSIRSAVNAGKTLRKTVVWVDMASLSR